MLSISLQTVVPVVGLVIGNLFSVGLSECAMICLALDTFITDSQLKNKGNIKTQVR